jgi:hypothetical protein
MTKVLLMRHIQNKNCPHAGASVYEFAAVSQDGIPGSFNLRANTTQVAHALRHGHRTGSASTQYRG